MTSNNNDLMPACLDRQISLADRDAFGHRHFAQALRSLIESEAHSPPFSIGLLGGWGTGKSSIKDLYVGALQDDSRKDANGHTRSDRTHTITFNAWRFGGRDQDIKRALLRHVYLELGGDEDNLQDRLFRQVSESRESSKGWSQYTWEVLKAWAMPIPAFVISLILLFLVLFLALSFLPLEGEWPRSFVVVSLVWAYSYILRQIKSPPVSGHTPVTRIDLPVTTAEQYEDLFLDQIKRFKSGQSKTPEGKKGTACERLVVFVDDLDRLSAEEMVLGLDAVRTFMEIPDNRLPDGLGLVFVISCDEERVADALSKGRRQGDLPGTVFNQSDARRYLDRIFQFRLEIPPFPRQDMRKFAIKQMGELDSIAADLKARGVSIESVIDRMIHVGVRNPRNALQIVNAFAQAWWLAKKRETEELGTDKPGGLHEGAVTGHPMTLGVLSAIKVNFPDFYKDLQGDPSLLHRFTDVLVRGAPITDQPPGTQQLLVEHYLIKTEEGSSFEARKEHRSLRQFLASLIGLRWPESLQSFLLLSEDPVSRKFGSKAAAIYEAFVSGDSQGVLESFGRHIDNNELKPEEARLLAQMVEDLRHETRARRDNASRVIADLVDRLPKEIRHMLLGPLCRELGDSAELRSLLGLNKLAKITAVAHEDDQRVVVSRLINDILVSEEEITFRLESMEPPNLEEAVKFAMQTVDLALPIRRDHGLEPTSDDLLQDWLIKRTVSIGGKRHQVSFGELEKWMGEHEDHLLTPLGVRYIDILAAEFEGEESPEFDVESAVARAIQVFESLKTAGENSRPDLWARLARYIALQQPEAAKAAWQTMAKYQELPNDEEISGFISAFVARLKTEAEDEAWGLDLQDAATTLLSNVRTRLIDLNESTLSSLASLAILWSQEDETSGFSCDILKELVQKQGEDSQSVIDNWIGRLLGDLPISCVKEMARIFSSLEQTAQSKVVAQLKPVISNDNIDEITANRYEAFVENLTDETWEHDLLKSHLDNLTTQVGERHANPNGYLHRIFPIIVKYLNHASPVTLGPALHKLFSQSKGQPKLHVWLHSYMVGRWPASSEELRPYDPMQIFNDGREIVLSQPQAASKGILRSLRDLVTRELVPSEMRSGVIEAACAIWSVDPTKAVDIMETEFGDLSSIQAADLVDAIDWQNEEQQNMLLKIWCSLSASQSAEDRLDTTTRILEKGLKGTEGEPDRGLRIWFDAQAEDLEKTLTDTITQPELNDTHRCRVWSYSVSNKSVSPQFFVDVVPKIVQMASVEETANQIFTEYEYLYAVLESIDNRSQLANSLMQAYLNASTKTIKSNIAEWCRKLSGEASLGAIDGKDLDDEDMTILESKFGRTSALKKLEKERKNINS
tara:strand:+ start:1617 stop:5702 length:4086 start_codon:yes stop_codon:yes gene_type:complete